MPLTFATRTHGRPTTDHPNAIPVPASGRSWLTRLLAGEVALPALSPAALPPADRTPVEASAVACALACPDLFIVDAPDRAVRERVLVELLRTAAGRGERVLLLSPDPAAADRATEAVSCDRAVSVVRALADNENPHRPVPAANRLTSTAVGPGRAEQLKREAALAISTLQAKLSRIERSRTAQARLAELAKERTALSQRLSGLDAEVRAEADGNPAMIALRADRDAAEALLEANRVALVAERGEKEAAQAACLKLLADGSKKSGFFARLFGGAKQAIVSPELQNRVRECERDLKDLEDREAKFRVGIEAVASRFEEEMDEQLAVASASRRAALESRLEALEAEYAQLDLSVREILPRPAAPDDTLRNGNDPRDNRAEIERELAVARARLEELGRTGADFARRMLAAAKVVIGTPGCHEFDPVFKALDRPPPLFDLLVLDHAEELTEADFHHLSRLAARWVLAGDAAFPPEPRPRANGAGHRSNHRPPAPTFAARAARLLDREPWTFEGDRLVFRLQHLSAEQRREATREPLLDHPHVELRMAAGDGGDPVLAEIAFPATTAIAAAKSFLFSQLGEVLLRPYGERQWRRADDQLTACWPLAEVGPAEWVELEPGVREKVTGAGTAAFTAAIAFDPATGWDEERAEAWLAARVPAASAGRVAVLPRTAAQGSPRPVPVG